MNTYADIKQPEKGTYMLYTDQMRNVELAMPEGVTALSEALGRFTIQPEVVDALAPLVSPSGRLGQAQHRWWDGVTTRGPVGDSMEHLFEFVTARATPIDVRLELFEGGFFSERFAARMNDYDPAWLQKGEKPLRTVLGKLGRPELAAILALAVLPAERREEILGLIRSAADAPSANDAMGMLRPVMREASQHLVAA